MVVFFLRLPDKDKISPTGNLLIPLSRLGRLAVAEFDGLRAVGL